MVPDHQLAVIFPGYFVLGVRQDRIVNERFIGNQSKCQNVSIVIQCKDNFLCH